MFFFIASKFRRRLYNKPLAVAHRAKFKFCADDRKAVTVACRAGRGYLNRFAYKARFFEHGDEVFC